MTLPLPPPIDRGCCDSPAFVLAVTFASGGNAIYGPCEMPGDLTNITSTLYNAAV